MTPDEARFQLASWRPDTPMNATEDPSLAEALALAERDPELREWLVRQRAAYDAACGAFRDLPVPVDLADRILANHRTGAAFPARRLWSRALAIAASLIGLGIALVWLTRPGPTAGRDYDTFRSRMVRAVLREYRMDIVTNDLASIRGFLAEHAAPANFELPPPLAALPPLGGGLLSWQGGPVAMVCLDGGALGTLFLFVAPSDNLPGAPPEAPALAKVSRLGTVGWSRDGRTYVLAAHTEAEELRHLVL